MPADSHATAVPGAGRGRAAVDFAVDFAVAGGGLIGLATARALHRTGVSVAVYDRAPGPGTESSGAAGGLLTALYPWEQLPGLDALERYSRAAWPGWCEAIGPDTGFRACGLLSLDTGYERAARTWARAHDEPFEVLEGTDLRAACPSLAPVHERALHFPAFATLDPRATVVALAARLYSEGVALHWNAPIARIRVEAGRARGLELEGGGRVEAGAVVVATGAWSSALLEPLGVTAGVRPVRGQIVELGGPPGLVPAMLVHDQRYLVPRADGRILVGSTSEEAGFDKTVSDEVARKLRDFAASLVPDTVGLEVSGHWAGLRPGSSAGAPFIGPVPGLDGLWLNTGHFRNGITLAAGSAELLAALATGAEAPLDPAPFKPG